MLKLKLQYFGDLMRRVDSLEKTLMLGGIGGRRRRGRQRMRWLDGITHSMHDFGWTPGVGDGQGGLMCWDSWGHKESDRTERLNWTELKMQKNRNPHILLVRIKVVQPLWKTIWHKFTTWLSKSTSRYLLKRNLWMETCKQMLKTASFITVQKWKKPKRPPIGEWINVADPYKGIVLNNRKKWNTDTYHNERSSKTLRMQKTTYCIIQLYEMSRKDKSLEAEEWIPSEWGWVVVQMLSCTRPHVCATPWTVSIRLLCPWDFSGKNTGVGCYFLLQGMTSWSLLKLLSIESMMPSNHLILCVPFLLLPSIFHSITVLRLIINGHKGPLGDRNIWKRDCDDYFHTYRFT